MISFGRQSRDYVLFSVRGSVAQLVRASRLHREGPPFESVRTQRKKLTANFMKGYVGNLEAAALANNDFRRVLYTARNSQLVLMSLGAGEEIGEETHELDQFLRFESGEGKVVLDGV